MVERKKYSIGYEHQSPGGTLKYLEKLPNRGPKIRHIAKWQCFCENTFEARLDHIIGNRIKSCGCWNKYITSKNLCYTPGYEHSSPRGTLTYLEKLPNRGTKYRHVAKWQCFCGNIFEARVDQVTRNKFMSCGCTRYNSRQKKNKQESHQKSKSKYGPGYEKQTNNGILKYLENIYSKKHTAKWQCFCGNIFESNIYDVANDRIKSCGCLSGLPYGQKIKDSQLIYIRQIYDTVKQRCYNPNNPSFQNYGGRGIKLSPEWINDRSKFTGDILQNLGHRPTSKHQLDRIDVNGDYILTNLRWVTSAENNRNKRNNKFITILGETKILQDWAREYKLNPGTILNRIKKNWPEDKILSPVQRSNKPFDNTKLRGIHFGIIDRCYNSNHPAWPSYGGRGINMQKDWINNYHKFQQDILDSIGPRPSQKHQLDRIDVNNNYQLSNLRWATPKENCRNKRNTIKIEIDGKIKTLIEWAEISGVNADTINRRLKKGYAEQDLLKANIKKRFSATQIQEIRRLNKNGMSMRALAKKFDCCHTIILDVLHNRGAYHN